MKLKHRHIICISLFLCGLLGFVSCTHESFGLFREEEGDNSVFLTFRTAVAGVSSRTVEGGTLADGIIRQMLVVIVSEEPDSPAGNVASDGTKWVVEHNSPIENASIGLPLAEEYTFKVRPGCRKRIYLIANYKDLKDADGNLLDFHDQAFIPQESMDGKAPVDEYVFSVSRTDEGGSQSGCYVYDPDLNGIPMTAVYEVTIPDRQVLQTDEYMLDKTLFVVRAATKFSFRFENRSAKRNISVNSIKMERVIADRMYLMPHVNKHPESRRYWVAGKEEGKDYSPYLLGKEETEVTGRDWIDWMVDEAAKTETDRYQWLTDYDIPPSVSEEEAVTHTFVPSLGISGDAPCDVPDAIYLPESKTQKSPADTLGLQEYKVTITTQEDFLDSNGERVSTKECIYTSVLPRLASLFRNTHAQITVSFNDYTLDWEVCVLPYSEVALKPEFGL